MATRRECREWVVQLLFQLDMNPSDDLGAVLDRFWMDKQADRSAQEFTGEMVGAILRLRDELDQQIRRIAEHWDLKRMGVLDRNVIRMAFYEMLHRPDIPPVVSINEAVDIAKYYSSKESGRFVNGILDCLRKELKRSPRNPSEDADHA